MADQHTVQAIVLRQQPLGESDALVVLFSREQGKLKAVAKGLKKPRSKLAGVCQMWTWGRFYLLKGRTFDRLLQAEMVDAHYALREDIWKVAYATYVSELVDRAVAESEPHETVFDLLALTLHQLGHADDPRPLVHSFELRLLAELGYEPVLDRCLHCGGPVDGPKAFFSAARGGLLCPDCYPHDRRSIHLCAGSVQYLRLFLRPGRQDLTRVHLSGRAVGELEAALRAHIRYHLETEPRSLSFLRDLRAAERAAG